MPIQMLSLIYFSITEEKRREAKLPLTVVYGEYLKKYQHLRNSYRFVFYIEVNNVSFKNISGYRFSIQRP